MAKLNKRRRAKRAAERRRKEREANMVECPKCKGKGVVPLIDNVWVVTCYPCKGKGKV